MSSIGLAIKKLRESKKWSLVKLGRGIGKSPGYISEIENGIKIPNLALIKIIAKKLKCDASFLRDLAVADKKEKVNKKIEKQYEE